MEEGASTLLPRLFFFSPLTEVRYHVLGQQRYPLSVACLGGGAGVTRIAMMFLVSSRALQRRLQRRREQYVDWMQRRREV